MSGKLFLQIVLLLIIASLVLTGTKILVKKTCYGKGGWSPKAGTMMKK